MTRRTARPGVRATRWRRAAAAGSGFFLVKRRAWLAMPVTACLAG